MGRWHCAQSSRIRDSRSRAPESPHGDSSAPPAGSAIFISGSPAHVLRGFLVSLLVHGRLGVDQAKSAAGSRPELRTARRVSPVVVVSASARRGVPSSPAQTATAPSAATVSGKCNGYSYAIPPEPASGHSHGTTPTRHNHIPPKRHMRMHGDRFAWDGSRARQRRRHTPALHISLGNAFV